MQNDLWIFGYGSIIWRVDFPYIEDHPAYICDWSRRFWQGSTDHRGTPEQPGRVVTLVPHHGEKCWGRAFRIASDDREQVLKDLDYREKGGYERLTLDLHFSDQQSVTGITYLATEANPNYLGEASVDEIASQVVIGHGPSGSNIEYVHRLHDALAGNNTPDEHVAEIAGAVSELLDSFRKE